MKNWKILLLNFTLITWFIGCSSHPPVLPQTPRDGVTNMGFQFSIENVIPVIWWKHGINDYTEIGFKLGMPLSGTGIDISRLLMKKEYRWDILNFAYSISPNPGFDLSYYMFKAKKNEKLSILFQLNLIDFYYIIKILKILIQAHQKKVKDIMRRMVIYKSD